MVRAHSSALRKASVCRFKTVHWLFLFVWGAGRCRQWLFDLTGWPSLRLNDTKGGGPLVGRGMTLSGPDPAPVAGENSDLLSL